MHLNAERVETCSGRNTFAIHTGPESG